MTAASKDLLANVTLTITGIILVVTFCGMFGWIPKLAPTRELATLGIILAIISGSLRRSARSSRAAPTG